MSNRRIALILTVCYWIIAVLAATFTPRSDWIDLRWPIAIYFFAIPTTILLWMVVMGAHFFRPALPPSRFTLIGIALPVVYVAVAVVGGRWLSEERGQRLEEQLRTASIAAFDDEPLAGARGPIGVRLRYRVAYPGGLDLDEGHGAFGQLGTSSSRSAFVTMRRVVAPQVSGHFPPGTYDITEEFIPAFLPRSLLYPKSEPAAADHCFQWSAGVSRQEVLAGSAELLPVAVYLAHVPIQRLTTHPYRLADFYATAVQEGAVDCAN